jgi:ABC-2 type transport system permease protein
MNKIKQKHLTQFALLLVIIVITNVLGQYVFHRFDLTAEKRYTLSPASKQLLGKVTDVVYVRVYLDGDFPAGFQRLRNETKEMLDEFRVIAGDNVQYEFINPSESTDPKQRNEIYENLAKKGLQPTNLQTNSDNGQQQQIIFPGALLTYQNREIPIQLLKSMVGASPEVMLNNSINDLEYEITNALRKVIDQNDRPIVGFLEGHGELSRQETNDLAGSVREYYDIKRVQINGKLGALNKYKAIVIAAPDSAFTEKDKFVIDQYIMGGGKVVWLIDGAYASMDSLSTSTASMVVANQTNLDDQLFRYGVRINHNVLQDMQCAVIPIVSGYVGNQPQTRMYPWMYMPLIFQTVKHPLVNNLNAVKLEFASTIDTLHVPNVSTQVLLTSSVFSRVVTTPARIGLGQATTPLKQEQFNASSLPVAVLLSGSFTSNFKNRVPTLLSTDSAIQFKATSTPTSMVVVSDGDIAKNYVSKNGKIYPLGFDRYTREQFGNKAFLLNAINYLCGDEALISIRSREVNLRLLDKTKIKTEKLTWQLINVAVPVLLILTLGIVLYVLRKRKYSK